MFSSLIVLFTSLHSLHLNDLRLLIAFFFRAYIFIFRAPLTIGELSVADLLSFDFQLQPLLNPVSACQACLVLPHLVWNPQLHCPHWFSQDESVRVLHLWEHSDRQSALVRNSLCPCLGYHLRLFQGLGGLAGASSSSSVPVVSAPGGTSW